MIDFSDPGSWLPLVFAGLMGVSILIYVILDGYDLGVGILIPLADDAEKDRMVASIGPFWDANETWLVLAVGLLLVAFPAAHGTILTALYLPVAVMLLGLILRGVAFEFRAKVSPPKKAMWNWLFFVGSLATALSQGFMLGMYVMGLDWTLAHAGFGILIAVCLAAAYAAIGAAWLIFKTEGDLQRRAVAWTQRSLIVTGLGMGAISLATPLVSQRIFEKWFSVPEIFALAPLPIGAGALFLALWFSLGRLAGGLIQRDWLPLILMGGIFALGFFGLAYSFYPYVVPEKLTIYEAAAAPESLIIILVGTLFVLPVIGLYTAYAYTVFRGKAGELRYD
jgi:cytochrome d ubiquinol oxidase subunit II